MKKLNNTLHNVFLKLRSLRKKITGSLKFSVQFIMGINVGFIMRKPRIYNALKFFKTRKFPR
jgi:hypothetical protein